MAQDIGYDFATGPTVTLLGSNLSDANTSAVTSAVDFGAAPTPFQCGFELKLDCQASSDNAAILLIHWSHDNSDFSDTSNPVVGTIADCTASTVAVKVGSFRIQGRYAKFSLQNDSGGTINSASTAVILWDISGDQA